ncbi:hypothetical protein LUZ61_015981 [Rhynchospora tenuis]|uniref:NmrA-like domain-containing protein n=1 Tax=Rhynchospora tenuis TaxID=198213 RepID=A0AAD5Z4M8_9POAL|nr:hypothetical protein LUZ61_015981 [Rhynchospora tenuis]
MLQCRCRRFLIESSGEVLLVTYLDKKFEIHRLEIGNGKGDPHWVEVTSIGDRMLFLDFLKDYGYFSIRVRASDIWGLNLKGNCIYSITLKDRSQYASGYAVERYDIETATTEYIYEQKSDITWLQGSILFEHRFFWIILLFATSSPLGLHSPPGDGVSLDYVLDSPMERKRKKPEVKRTLHTPDLPLRHSILISPQFIPKSLQSQNLSLNSTPHCTDPTNGGDLPKTMASTVERKSRVLVIGALDYIGKYMAIASVKLGHPTLVLLPSFHSADPDEKIIILSFIEQGVTLFKGDIYNHTRLVQAVRAVDVVILTVGYQKVMDQTRIIAAIQEAGNITRFIPYEDGINVNRCDVHAQTGFGEFLQMRRFIEQSGVPYTYVVWNFCTGNFLGHSVHQSQLSVPPRIRLFGDGNTKVVFTAEEDIGLYTILAADDLRTLNKSLYIRPPENIISLNELVSLWERKVNRTFIRNYVSGERILKQLQEASPRRKTLLAIIHAAFIRGYQTNFEIDPSMGGEASQLYPHINYTTLSEVLDRLILN